MKVIKYFLNTGGFYFGTVQKHFTNRNKIEMNYLIWNLISQYLSILYKEKILSLSNTSHRGHERIHIISTVKKHL